MTQALRSPGSTLKPFIYGLALRGRAHPSRDADRGPAGALRQLRAGEFRSDVPGHGDGAPGAATVAQRAGGRACSTRSAPSRLAARLHAGRRARWCCRRAKRRASRWGSAASASRSPISPCSMPGWRAAATTLPLIERATATRERRPRRLLDPVAAWYVGNVLIGAPPPDNAAARPHRLQDRHLLRLSRRLVGRLRRPHDHRRLGRPAGRRAGAGPGRPRRAPRRSCSTRSRAPARCRRRSPRAPKGALFAATAQLPPPLQRFRAGRAARRGGDRAAHHVPAERRAARTRRRRRRAGAAQDRRRRRAADRAGQRRAAAAPDAAAARCSSRPTGRASCG